MASRVSSQQSTSTSSSEAAFLVDEFDDGEHLAGEDLAVKELNELSPQERDDLYAEIHGIQGKLTKESPEFLQQIFSKLDHSLALISVSHRKAYDRAVFLKPSLVEDRAFHLMFLRSCKYETAQTATRICAFFRNKLILFGEALLVKKVTLEDLSADDLDSLEKSRATFLPSKDQSGRFVFLDDGHNMHFKEPVNMVSSKIGMQKHYETRILWLSDLFVPDLLSDSTDLVPVHGLLRTRRCTNEWIGWSGTATGRMPRRMENQVPAHQNVWDDSREHPPSNRLLSFLFRQLSSCAPC